MPTDPDHLRQVRDKAISGTLWSILGHAGQYLPNLIFTIVLARLLTPADFGLLGMVLAFTGIAAFFLDLGFSAAIIQRPELEDDFYHTAFCLQFGLGIFLTVALVAAAPLIANFYGEPRLLWITRLLALRFVLISACAMPRARARRDLAFRYLAVRDIVAALAAGGSGVALAWRGWGVYSLVAMYLVEQVVSVVIFWCGPIPRPRFVWRRQHLRHLFRFGSELTLTSLLVNLVRQTDALLIGKYFHAHSLGIYTRAVTFMLLPVTHISQVLNKVLFPTFSRLQHERRLLRDICLQSVSGVALVTFPLMAGLWVTAEHVVIGLFGEVWRPTIAIVRILCVVGALQSVSGAPGAIFTALGETRKQLLGTLVSSALLLTGFGVGIWRGNLRDFALIYAGINVILYVPRFWYVGRLVGMSPFDAVRALGGVAGGAVLMGLAVWGVDRMLPAAWPHLVSLGVEVAVGVAVYGLLIHSFGVRAYRDVCRIGAEKFRQWRERPA